MGEGVKYESLIFLSSQSSQRCGFGLLVVLICRDVINLFGFWYGEPFKERIKSYTEA